MRGWRVSWSTGRTRTVAIASTATITAQRPSAPAARRRLKKSIREVTHDPVMRRSSDPARGQGPTCELGDSRPPAAACRIEAGRACVVRHRYYPGDQRMENQIRALLAAGYEVDVFCLRQKGEPRMSVENGVRVFRTWAVPRKRAGFLRYIAEYLSFWLASLWFLTRRQITHRYDLILVLRCPIFCLFRPSLPGYSVRGCWLICARSCRRWPTRITGSAWTACR